MRKDVLPQLLLIIFVVAFCAIWTTYQYLNSFEERVVTVKKEGEVTEVVKKVHKFPVNLGLDLKGGVRILLEALKPEDGILDDEKMRGLVEVMQMRLNPTGTREVTIQRQGDKWVNIEIPGERDPEKVEQLIGKVAKLEFVDSKGELWEDGFKVPEDADVILTGDDLGSVSAGFDQYGKPSVNFQFKSEANDIFGKFTARNIDNYLAIVLDGHVVSCPRINSAIFGGGQITGNFSTEEVQTLVAQLKSGQLPVEVEVAEKHAVGPTLGAESIRKSLMAGILGISIVLVFMIAYYRLPGLMADLALVCYVVIMVGAMSIFGVTLTLPGIAGFILSIGMAVDANIIIFERLREEIRIGKTLKAALDAGFARAFAAILDANVTTLIASVVLYGLGTGPIRGFAVTLSLGILVSMFSAIVITKVFMILIVNMPACSNLALYGAKPENPEIAAAQSRS